MNVALKAVGSAIDERLRLNRWFRLNAAAKNGVPWSENEEAIQVEHYIHTEKAPSVDPSVVPTDVPPPTIPIPSSTKTWKDCALWAAPIVMLLLGGTGGWWLNREEPVAVPEKPPAVEVVPPVVDRQGSLLQDLEDRGFHLPAEQ